MLLLSTTKLNSEFPDETIRFDDTRCEIGYAKVIPVTESHMHTHLTKTRIISRFLAVVVTLGSSSFRWESLQWLASILEKLK